MSEPTLPVDENGCEYIEFDGHRRLLGKLLPDPGVMGSFPRYEERQPMVDPSEWREIDRRGEFGPDVTEDQNGFNSCSSESATVATAKSAVLMGRPYVRLSPALPYAMANGGRDAGSVIGVVVRALMNEGTCEFSVHGRTPFYRNQIPGHAWQEAKRVRILEAYRAENWRELCSGIQRRFIAIYGIQVGRNFGELSDKGVAPVVRGPGNHAMHADGMKFIGGKPYVDNHNSWGNRFGENGRCYLGEEHFRGVKYPDMWLIRAVVEDPQNYPPPLV